MFFSFCRVVTRGFFSCRRRVTGRRSAGTGRDTPRRGGLSDWTSSGAAEFAGICMRIAVGFTTGSGVSGWSNVLTGAGAGMAGGANGATGDFPSAITVTGKKTVLSGRGTRTGDFLSRVFTRTAGNMADGYNFMKTVRSCWSSGGTRANRIRWRKGSSWKGIRSFTHVFIPDDFWRRFGREFRHPDRGLRLPDGNLKQV